MTRFDVSSLSVERGSTVTVSWRVTNAAEITITAMPGGVLVDKTSAAEGTVESFALQEETTFVLSATGEGGTATAMKTVEVTTRPAEVRIVQFTASALSVAPGTEVSLSWEVANATSMKIDVLGGENLLTTTEMFTGSLTVRPSVETSYVLTAEGEGGPKTQTVTISVEGTPVIVAFAAEPPAIELGGTSTISWSVTGANMVTVRSSGGTDVYAGGELVGEAVVSPAADETYTLTARSPLGQEVTAQVTVSVNRAARVLSFTATPSSVDYGDSASLQWLVDRATGVELRSGATVLHTSTDLMGTFTVSPLVTTSYTLVAQGPDGDGSAVATVTVDPAAPRLVTFEAIPNPVLLGGITTLRFATIGAVSVRIDDPSGTAVYDGLDAASTVDVTVTATVAIYTLTATNPHGTTQGTVIVLGQPIPEISQLDVSPLTFSTASQVVTITWASSGTSTELSIDGAVEATFPGTPSGTYTATVTRTAVFTLVASNAVGSATAERRVLQLTAEAEPNDDAAGAIPLAGDGGGAGGEIGPAGDVDFYAVTVPANGNLRAEVSDGNGGCAFDTLLSLYDTDGTTLLGSDDDDGVDLCSALDPLADPFAANLSGGTYYLAVSGTGAAPAGAYALLVVASPAACANGILERGAGEQCDDANTVSTDGCDAACQLEPDGVIGSTGETGTFTGTVDEVGDVDWFQVTLTTDGYIFAETFMPVEGRCDNAAGGSSDDMIITLYDASFNVLGSDDNDGIGSCARIDPIYDGFAAVSAGTYWIQVGEDGANSTLGPYTIVIQTYAGGCPNGVIDGLEECDDGNGTDGDGCSSLCLFEGLRDVEPNGTTATAQALTANPALVMGSITPVADLDVYAVTVPAGHHLDAYLTLNSLDSCPVDPVGRLQLLGTNGTTVLATNSDGGPGYTCGRIWPYTDVDSAAMAAGTYYLRVNESGDNAEIARYFLHVRLIAPGCGNGIIEAPEVCDDGNPNSGDGCSDTCALEPLQVVTLPGAPVTIAGRISPSYIRNAIQLDVTQDTALYAATFSPDAASGICPSPAATRIQLYAADGTTVLGTDTTDGVDSCSELHPARDAFAILTVGTYLLVVDENGNNRDLYGYELVVDGRAANTCGNRVREAAEQCDDGGTISGDGCDATCAIEPIAVLVGPTINATVSGALEVVGEQDFIRLDLSAPSIIIAETYIPTVGICTGGDTILRLLDATMTELASNDDISGAANRCSRIDGIGTAAARVEAGTYFLRVEDFSNNELLPAYQVTVDVRAQDACGNGLQEPEGGETCDDGNVADGDGCSSACALEPTYVVSLAPGGAQSLLGTLAVATQRDVVRLDVAQTLYLRAETFAPAASTCTGADTFLTLMSSTGVVLATDDLDGVGSCSLIQRATDAGARLEPGSYYLIVEEDGRNAVIGAYQLDLAASTADLCGDGILEGVAGEACDDGNVLSGDGCDSFCAVEIAASYTLPSADAVIAGALLATTSALYVQLEVTVTSYVRAEVNAPAWPDCVGGIDPILRLYDAAFVQLGSDDLDGRSSCSLFNPDVDTFARLAPGTYFASIEEDGRNAVLGAFEVRVQSAPADVCGNGYLETALGEQCDDGNLASGDGCSVTCQIDVTTAEVEPNETIATANVTLLAGLGLTTVSGNVTPSGDFDYFQLVVPPGPMLVLRARTYSAAGNPLSVCGNDIDTRLILYSSAGTELENNDDINGSANRCSRIDGTLPDTDPNARLVPGLYYLRVSHFSSASPAPAGPYFLEIKLQP